MPDDGPRRGPKHVAALLVQAIKSSSVRLQIICSYIYVMQTNVHSICSYIESRHNGMNSIENIVMLTKISSLLRVLGAVAKLRKSTMSFVMSVHPASMEQFGFHSSNFHEI